MIRKQWGIPHVKPNSIRKMLINSIYNSLDGIVPDRVIAIASCIPGENPLAAALLIAQAGIPNQTQLVDTTPFTFNTTPGQNGTLAASGPVADIGVTWTLEYMIDDHWEAFDEQPPNGFFDVRVQWPTTKARLIPNAVVDHIDVMAVS